MAQGIDALLTVARTYSEATGTKLDTVSRRAFNDGKRIRDLKAGKDITVGRLERTLQWFSDHWPNSVSWPDDVSRPEPQSTSYDVNDGRVNEPAVTS